ncbi:MAG: phenylalanine--tRNA ligase subunit beta [Candidatus Levybacteria bacterium CG10_big_fil_rev_8_21_14_0_10_36_7]|nr:MAG: phenylalanine--tRNA ligase subunit beta [Candidatus Levybacteria bacterium CG10_big_fil_rev_8_21_14_0_10_36_7]
MQIQILDSWLREYLKTKASAIDVSKNLSLTSVSVERVEKLQNDYLYDIEVTTNRPDLMSVVGLAREAAAVLTQQGIKAEFSEPKLTTPIQKKGDIPEIEIVNNSSLVNRICAVIMDVKIKDTPSEIKERIEASGIRSLNNLIDVTNYVMREMGHPSHVFDYDKLTSKKLIIRESKKGEKITTLDNREYILSGGDIVADNGKGEIVDLLGVMGLKNSAVDNNTKRILFFLDNNEKQHIRKTSMELAIRSEAAVLNEKGIDPQNCYKTLLRGIELFEKIADGKVASNIIDIYPNKIKSKTISVFENKINQIIGVDMPIKKSAEILEKLGFEVKLKGNQIAAVVPSFRIDDMNIEEDLIEEIARVYGYHNLPDKLPEIMTNSTFNMGANIFFWEKRIKNAFKYWGFTQTYSYSMVSENLLEGPIDEAVTIQNPLDEEHVYMRRTLVPSLLQIVEQNPTYDVIKIFEIANIYIKNKDNLPDEKLKIAAVIKQEDASFLKTKGIIEQLLNDLGITNLVFKKKESGGVGADIYIDRKKIGEIEKLDEQIIDFELDFNTIIENATLLKNYIPVPKFPPIVEDIRVTIDPKVSYLTIVNLIHKQHELVKTVELIDIYEDKKTFRVIYQNEKKNLKTEDIIPIREKIIKSLEKNLDATVDKFE